MIKIPQNTVNRLILYRKLLRLESKDNSNNIFSHRLATLAGVTAAQVRRDLMLIGYSGSPVRGYKINELAASIDSFLDTPACNNVAIIGVGKLGRAIMDYCYGIHSKIQIVAAFDIDPLKVDRVIHGVYCHHIKDLEKYIKENSIKVAIITVTADEAQKVADMLIYIGITGILNYTPKRLSVPETVYVQNQDMMMSLEKVAFFAGRINKGL